MSIPKIFEYGLALYKELESQAEDGVFQGSKTGVYRSIGISQGYYTKLYGTLTELGCIEQIHRGSGEGFGRHSIIRLHHPPEAEAFMNVYAKPREQLGLTAKEQLATLSHDVASLNRRVPNIDLNRYILSFEQRLTDLEDRVRRVEQDQQGEVT